MDSEFPSLWEDMQKAPAFIISVDENRYSICKHRAMRAGFINVHHIHGINRDDPEELEKEATKYPFAPEHKMIGSHPTAVMLAHLKTWLHIIENNIPYAIIFEDDVLFHTDWHALAQFYYDVTPKRCDMMYMGHHCGNVHPHMPIVQAPMYCLNAYLITQAGTRKLYEMITKYPYDNFGVIDMMLVKLQQEVLFNQNNPYQYIWYGWNSQMYPDQVNEKRKHPDSLTKDMGLVFQQYPFFKLKEEEDTYDHVL